MHQWLTPIILVTQEAEIRRMDQHRQIVLKTLSQKTFTKTGLVEWLKVKALSSNLSATKQQQQQQKKNQPVVPTQTYRIRTFILTKSSGDSEAVPEQDSLLIPL
jgi:hypothetical protein